MSLVYRTVFSDDLPDLPRVARTFFAEWIASKGVTLDVPESGRVDNEANTVEVLSDSDGDLDAVRLRLDEESGGGERWSTIVTAMATPDEGWLWLDLERVSDDVYGRPPVVAPPRLIRTFLESSVCRAGSTVLRSTFKVIDEHGVEDLLDELLDPGRTVPVNVVSRDNADPGAARARAEALIGAVVGMANVWALEGMATSQLSARLGDDLHVYGGAVRTYLPGLTIPDRYPGRHRFARKELFEPNPRHGAQVIARALTSRAVHTRPPLLFRQRVSLMPGFTRHGRDAGQLLEELLGVEEDRDRIQAELDWQILETEEEATRAETAESRVRWLERQLADANLYVSGVPTPESAYPSKAADCVQALELAKQFLPQVVVGDTMDSAEALEQHVKSGIWGQKAWDALRALESYAEAKGAGTSTGNFLSFCRTSPPGSYVIPTEWVAAAENETTTNNPRFRRARTFPVPTEVNADGEVYMEEHIKLEKGSDPAPRMHFWDDTGGRTGKIYVGYLGRHLPSFDTN